MRHNVKKGRKLSRNSGQRNSLMRNLLTSLLEHEHLTTTEAKAKEVKREFDILVNRAKRAVANEDFSIKRNIFSFLTKKDVSLKLFNEVLPKFNDRVSGYLTVVKTGHLRNDAAENVFLQFVKGGKDGKKDEIPGASKVVASARRKSGTSGKISGKNK